MFCEHCGKLNNRIGSKALALSVVMLASAVLSGLSWLDIADWGGGKAEAAEAETTDRAENKSAAEDASGEIVGAWIDEEYYATGKMPEKSGARASPFMLFTSDGRVYRSGSAPHESRQTISEFMDSFSSMSQAVRNYRVTGNTVHLAMPRVISLGNGKSAYGTDGTYTPMYDYEIKDGKLILIDNRSYNTVMVNTYLPYDDELIRAAMEKEKSTPDGAEALMSTLMRAARPAPSAKPVPARKPVPQPAQTQSNRRPAFHTVIFDLDGGTRTGGGELEQKVPRNKSAVAPKAAREGYYLSGWSEDYKSVQRDVTIKARWGKNRGTAAPAPAAAPAVALQSAPAAKLSGEAEIMRATNDLLMTLRSCKTPEDFAAAGMVAEEDVLKSLLKSNSDTTSYYSRKVPHYPPLIDMNVSSTGIKGMRYDQAYYVYSEDNDESSLAMFNAAEALLLETYGESYARHMTVGGDMGTFTDEEVAEALKNGVRVYVSVYWRKPFGQPGEEISVSLNGTPPGPTQVVISHSVTE